MLKIKRFTEKYTVAAKTVRGVALTASDFKLAATDEILAIWAVNNNTNPTLYFVSNSDYDIYIGNNSSTTKDLQVTVYALYYGLS